MGSAFLRRILPHSSSGDLVFRVDEDNLQIRIEQLRTRMEMYPALIFSQVILQPFLVWMFWDHAPHLYLLLWLACFYGLHAAEVVNWILHSRNPDSIEWCRAWHGYFTESDSTALQCPAGNSVPRYLRSETLWLKFLLIC